MSIVCRTSLHMHHKAHLKFYTEQFHPAWTCIKHHILRGYLQYSMWHHSLFLENIEINLDKYGHKSDEGESLVPSIITELSTPVSFSISCDYFKCSYANIPFLWKRRQLFVIAIENVKMMRNTKIHELKTIIKLSFIQEFGLATSR